MIGGQKVIAVVASTRDEAAAGIAHARTSVIPLPVWVWCAEPGEAPALCDRYAGSAGAWQILRELHQVWPALSIVAWTGHGMAVSKVIPFIFPPFRVVVFNEAYGFFAARPGAIAGHVRRRSYDASRSGAIRVSEWTRSIAYRFGERIRDVFLLAWNFVLAIAAFCAHAIAPLAFIASEGRRGGVSSPLSPPISMSPAASGDCIDVPISARAWRRGRFLRTIERSEATFVLLHRGVFDLSERDGLIELARRTNSFAVAKQQAFTGWRKQVLPKHPFRTLQPGEASAVLAPHSSMIVMRRDMLLQLGVPHAITNGTALMIIYWKAAAAGLQSLSVGANQTLLQEPAMPLEDAEFVLRSKGITPLNAEETRGNVAFFPCIEQLSSGKPRVLVVSPYLPYPLSHGGAVRMYNLCRALRNEVDFTLACFHEAGEHVNYGELHRVFQSVYVVDINEKHPDATVPEQVAGYRNTAMAALIRRLCAQHKLDIVQLEYTQMAEYRTQAGDVPVILVEHDITFTLHKQIVETVKTPEVRTQYERWLAFERTSLQNVSAVWTMSEPDRALAVECGASKQNVVSIPNGVDLDRFRPTVRNPGAPAILFVGSFRHLPNLLAFAQLRDTIMPIVWEKCPTARVHVIAGPHHEKAASLAGKARLLAHHPLITIQGFVDDVRTAYQDCDAVAVPLPISAGTNIKVMEAMACGRAVVSTTVGCQGLDLCDGHDVLIRDTPDLFADALLRLLLHEEERNAIQLRARQTVEQRFGWDAIALTALGSYASLTAIRIAQSD